MSAMPTFPSFDRLWMAMIVLPFLLCWLTSVAGQQVTPSPDEGAASQPTADSVDGPFPTFNFTASLSSVLSQYNIPGGVVSLISLPTSSAQSRLASSLLQPPPLCPYFVNGLSAAGVRRVGSSTAVNVSDAFHHGSNTKAMTALLVNQQVERGRLRWNQTLASLFPYLPWSDGTPHESLNRSAGYFAGSPYAANITIDASWHTVSIQQLLTHTSGIDTGAGQYQQLLPALFGLESSLEPIALRRINVSDSNTTFPVPSRQYFLQQMLSLPVPFPSHSVNEASSLGYSYSNYNYMLLGCVLEELHGRAWELIIGELFARLAMLSAGFGPPEIDVYTSQAAPQQPWPHYMHDEQWQAVGLGYPYQAIDNPEALGPAGTVHASLVDWARLTACHLLEGRGENSTTAEPAPLLLLPATWAKVHSPFVWPATGRVATAYSLSGYVSIAGFPVGWGDTQLAHDGSNGEWYSRSSVYLHGSQPFAVLAAFNAAPSIAADAMTALFDAVTGRYTRWLDAQQRRGQTCNTSSASSYNSSNAPISILNGTYYARWRVDTVYLTPITLHDTALLSSMNVYPTATNAASGTYTLVLAVYSDDGVLLGQTGQASFTGSHFRQPLQPLTVPLPSALYLLNGTYYVSLWYTHTAAADLFVYAYPTSAIYWLAPNTTFAQVKGDLSRVDVSDRLYGAGEWSFAALLQLTAYSAVCRENGSMPSGSPGNFSAGTSRLPARVRLSPATRPSDLLLQTN